MKIWEKVINETIKGLLSYFFDCLTDKIIKHLTSVIILFTLLDSYGMSPYMYLFFANSISERTCNKNILIEDKRTGNLKATSQVHAVPGHPGT